MHMLLQNVVTSTTTTVEPNNQAKQDLLCDWAANSWNIETNPYSYPPNPTRKRRKLHDHHHNSLVNSPLDPIHANRIPSTDTIDTHPTNNINKPSIDDTVQSPLISLQKYNKHISPINNSLDSQFPSPPLQDQGSSFSSLNAKNKFGCTTTTTSDTEESPISKLVVSGENLSARDLCISVLTSYGLLVTDWPVSSAPTTVLGTCEDSGIFQYCELCGILGNTLNMLLCDHCEGAFHVSCCNPKIKMLPIDGWFCSSCSKLDEKVSLEATFLKSLKISWCNGLAKSKPSPIESMLKYPEPYMSRVRIGDSFQAAVPQWSDQFSQDFDCIGEPLEMDPADTIGIRGSSTEKHLKPNSLNNWLQCQEVLFDGTGEGNEGTICGKWRRAPFSVFQTDEWDCSCSVLWDSSHSDCAVPQELETDEVLRQLKYIDQLRSRFAAKKSMNS